MSKIDERLNEIAKNIDTAFYSTFDVNPDDDMCWLIDRCRKLEKVAEAAKVVASGRGLDHPRYSNLQLIMQGEERDNLLEALKALGEE